LRNCKLLGSLRHAPSLNGGQKNAKLAELEPLHLMIA
jgi:hypothetical protein